MFGTVTIDQEKGRAVAALLRDAFENEGLFGETVMPETLPPSEVSTDSPEHILFLTLTVAIDYQRDAAQLWEAARKTYEDPETSFLFDPEVVSSSGFDTVVAAMQRHKLSKKHRNDAFIWITNAGTFHHKWNGNPLNFLADCNWDAPVILQRLQQDKHRGGKSMTRDFPFLGGKKIGPLWLRMLRDSAGVTAIRNMEAIPIPVDVHVARASLCLGVVQGQYDGKPEPLFVDIRRAWAQSVNGCRVGSRPMIALDVDEALWTLSRLGCSNRNKATGFCPLKKSCVVGTHCIPGVVDVKSDHIRIETGSAGKSEPTPSDSGRKLVIVPCGKGKIWDAYPNQGPVPARYAYTGNLFHLNRQYAEQFGDRWVILSAKYGFIEPDTCIEAYNVSFKDLSTRPVDVARLKDQIRSLGLNNYPTVIGLGGLAYRQAVSQSFKGVSVDLRFPFEDTLGIGDMMKKLKESMTNDEE